MDLGATICTPKSPDCGVCPWAKDCQGRIKGIASTLPRKAPKKLLPTRLGQAFYVTRDDGAVLLRRRPAKGLLGGMMEVPGTEWQEQGVASPLAQAPVDARWQTRHGQVTHTFTHFHLQVTVWIGEIESSKLPELDASYSWIAADAVAAQALPTVMRKIIAHALGR